MRWKAASSDLPELEQSQFFDPQFQLNPWHHFVLFLLACAVVISRRPDGLFHAQFYAEDGHVWFANAYNMGWWRPLLHPQDGYFQTFPRLGAAMALLAPLAAAPLVMNLLAFAMQALPVNLLLSARSARWGSLRFRAALAFVYLALPNCTDISLGITESQWLLALCAFLVLFMAPPRGWAGRLADLALLVLCGLTGPFCIFLFPIAVAAAWKLRDNWRWTPVCVLGACTALQGWSLLVFAPASRPHYALGASPAMLARILGGNIFLGVLVGHNRLAMIPGIETLAPLICVTILGTAIAAACFLKSDLPMRSLLVLSAVIFAASLVSSDTRPPAGVSVWQILAATSGGARYWFFPSLAFAWALLWCARGGGRGLKPAASGLLCLLILSVPLRWRRPVLPDMHFGELTARFSAAPAGTVMVIPENPEGWTVRLVRAQKPGTPLLSNPAAAPGAAGAVVK